VTRHSVIFASLGQLLDQCRPCQTLPRSNFYTSRAYIMHSLGMNPISRIPIVFCSLLGSLLTMCDSSSQILLLLGLISVFLQINFRELLFKAVFWDIDIWQMKNRAFGVLMAKKPIIDVLISGICFSRFSFRCDNFHLCWTIPEVFAFVVPFDCQVPIHLENESRLLRAIRGG